MDKWDGAVAARQRLFDGLTEARIANAIVLTGDIHQNWAGELKANFDDPESKRSASNSSRPPLRPAATVRR
jgi:alkaline phosphatase D